MGVGGWMGGGGGSGREGVAAIDETNNAEGEARPRYANAGR